MATMINLQESTAFDVKRAVRNDKFVAEVQIREDLLGVVEEIYASPRVLTQTPKAGTQVARGSTVNLVLANGRTVSAGVIGGGYVAWQAQPLGKVYDDFLKNDTTMTTLVAKYGEDRTLSEAERTQVLNTLQAKGVAVGTDTGSNFDSVMVTLGAANAFNGVAG